jgi:putative spermidine/putrescine transport system substrate-binding protein
VIANLAQAEKAPVQVVLPKEGATGWSDTWMVGAKSKHKTCAYKFIDHIVSPKTNAAIAEYFGEAPVNRKACAETVDKNHCATFHAADEKYFSKVHYWTTPSRRASTAARASRVPITPSGPRHGPRSGTADPDLLIQTS